MDNAEVWKDIPHYEGRYQVSNYGRIWSVYRSRIIKPFTEKRGYQRVQLAKATGKYQMELVHRLVALAFIPNPNKYTQVNHKDENPTNNRVENLEWCDAKYNTNYSAWKMGYCIKQLDINGNIIAKYRSLTDAERKTGISRKTIKKILDGAYKGSCQYIFELEVNPNDSFR